MPSAQPPQPAAAPVAKVTAQPLPAVAQAAAPAPLPAPPNGFYRCPASGAYYPDVLSCPGDWRLVADAPPAARQ
jgi:hypothetical protein